MALGSWDLPFGYAREDTQKFQGLGWWVGGVPRSAGSRHALLKFKKPAKPPGDVDCTKHRVGIGLGLRFPAPQWSYLEVSPTPVRM